MMCPPRPDDTRQELAAIWARADRHVRDALPEVRDLLVARFAAAKTLAPNIGLAQNGLRDGVEIAEAFLQQGEYGEALEHLCYVVREAELRISAAAFASLHAAGTIMRLDPAIWEPLAPTSAMTPQSAE